ncbi:zinc ABC transporter substrate-binding protein [bacterium]|nr:zinc ABC transporter substrate-binding protein [bacterium]
MPRFSRKFTQILYLTFCLGLIAGSDSAAGKGSVSCSNSFLASLVGALLGDEVDCLLILGPENNPREPVSLDDEQVAALERSTLFYYHPFQTWMARAMDHFEKQHAKKNPMRGKMNLIVPEDFLSAAREMQKSLAQYYPEYTTYMQEQYDQLLEMVKATENLLLAKSRKSKLMGLTCISGKRQAHYLKWLGLKVVATFDETKALNALHLKKMKNTAVAMDVWLVVGDHQNSGVEMIGKIAEAIAGETVVLDGFPVIGMDGEHYSWEDLIKNNTQALLQAVEWH